MLGMGKVKSKTVETINVDQPVLHPSEVKYDLESFYVGSNVQLSKRRSDMLNKHRHPSF